MLEGKISSHNFLMLEGKISSHISSFLMLEGKTYSHTVFLMLDLEGKIPSHMVFCCVFNVRGQNPFPHCLLLCF